AMMSLPAAKGFEIGSGFEGTRLRGSEHNDVFVAGTAAVHTAPATQVPTAGGSESASASTPAPTVAGCASMPALMPRTNHAGGVLGGISSGARVDFRVAIKPVSTIGRPQETLMYDGTPTTLRAKGRHDACVLPRTPALVEAMAALVIADLALLQRSRVGTLWTLSTREEEAEAEAEW
ncbi:chorismate synthase, partial [archaeon]